MNVKQIAMEVDPEGHWDFRGFEDATCRLLMYAGVTTPGDPESERDGKARMRARDEFSWSYVTESDQAYVIIEDAEDLRNWDIHVLACLTRDV